MRSTSAKCFELHPPIECRPVHLRHAEVREDQIVDVGADAFERGMPIGDHIDLAVSIVSYRTGHEIAKERIIVYHQDPRTLEAWRMHVTVGAPVARFAIRKTLAAADRAEVTQRRIPEAVLPRLSENRNQPPPPVRTRHRNALNVVAAPLDRHSRP